MWCPLAPLVYAGCSTAACAAGQHSVCPRTPPPAWGMPSTVGSQTQPTWQHHLCLRQSRSAGLTLVVPRTTAFLCRQLVVEQLGSLSLRRGGCEPRPTSPPAGSASGSPGPGAPGTHFPAPSAPTPTNNGASRCATAPPPPPLNTHGTYAQARRHLPPASATAGSGGGQ